MIVSLMNIKNKSMVSAFENLNFFPKPCPQQADSINLFNYIF